MKLPVALFVVLSACGSALSAHGIRHPAFEGVWKVTEIVVTGAGASTVSTPQPSVFIFAKSHYSLMWVPGSTPRALFKAQVPTNEEKLAAFDSLVASSGTYGVSGPRFDRSWPAVRTPS